MSNSTYDGFAMYIEGDDSGTKFIVEKNTFINNVIKNQGDQNANRKSEI